MTALDAADLVVIAGRTLGIDTGAALDQMDIAVAEEALAEAWPSGSNLADPGAAAAAAIGLMHALLRHRPFPHQGRPVAVAAGLQFLSLNGWRADLDPPATAAVVVEALASGRLRPDDAAAWLSPRLTPAGSARRTPAVARRTPASARRAPAGASRAQAGASRAQAGAKRAPGPPRARRGPATIPAARASVPAARASVPAARASTPAARASVPAARASIPAARASGGRTVAGVLLAVAVGGAALLAAACSRAPNVPAAPTSVVHTIGTSTPTSPPASVP